MASALVERYDLVPPVDVLGLLRDVADVEFCDWPFQCDGLAVGLASERPKIFIRTSTNPRRRRFTMAHELGHVRLIWHLDSIYCHTEGASPPVIDPHGFGQESEADEFASALLIPDRFLSRIVQGYDTDIDGALADLSRAKVSALAGLLALKDHLPPGFIFEYSGMRHPIRSTGTVVPDQLDRRSFKKAAAHHGRVRHQGQDVHWYQLVEPEYGLTHLNDSRTSREVLAGIVDRTWDGDSEVATGIIASIGGVLSRMRTESNPAVLLGIMRHRIEGGRFARLLEDPEGEIFLQKRAAEIAAKRGGSD